MTHSRRVCTFVLVSALFATQSCTDPTMPSSALTLRTGKVVNSDPVVSSVAPSAAPQNVTLDVAISGSGFTAGSTAKWLRGGLEDPRVTTNSTTVVSSTSIKANITIAEDAVPSLYDVAVITPMGKKGIGTEKFTVLAMEQLTAPAGSSGAHDINSSGEIAGSVAGGCDQYNLPAKWKNGIASTLPLPPGLCRGRALRITEGGVILGQAYPAGATSLTQSVPLIWRPADTGYAVQDLGVTESGRPYDILSANELGHAVVNFGIYDKAFWWSEATGYVLLKVPSSSFGCYVNDVNDTDEVVGACGYTAVTTPTRYYLAVYWASPSSDPVVLPQATGYNYVHQPHAINNNGVVVGQVWKTAKTGPVKSGARWIRNGSAWTVELVPGFGGSELYPYDVDDSGWVTGYSYVSAQKKHAFLWKSGVPIRDLGAIGNESWAEAITTTTSGEHLIVGQSSTANDDRAVLWHPDR